MNPEQATAPPLPRHPLSALDRPVLPPVISQMKVDIVVNEKSEAWLLHDAAFSETIKWAEYDADFNKVWIVLLSGRQQELGIVIPEPMKDLLAKTRQLYLMQLDGKKVTDCGMVPLMVRKVIQ